MIVGDSICGHSQPNLSFLGVFYFAARGGAGEVEREGGREGKEEEERKHRKSFPSVSPPLIYTTLPTESIDTRRSAFWGGCSLELIRG